MDVGIAAKIGRIEAYVHLISRQKKADLTKIVLDIKILKENHYRIPVIISNQGDPYDPGRLDTGRPKKKGLGLYVDGGELKEDTSFTRSVLNLFRMYDQPFRILTKGMLEAADFDLYGKNDWFSCSLTCDNDVDSRYHEPGAALPESRIEALKEAHSRGIRTWVNFEPVLYPEQTLNLIKLTHEFVDFYNIGKLNIEDKKQHRHYEEYKDREEKIDWKKFRTHAEDLLQILDRKEGKDCQINLMLARATK